MRRIRARLFVGPGVSPTDVPRLRRGGITAVLSLQEPGRDVPEAVLERMRAACAPGIEFRNVAIRDYDPDDLIRNLDHALGALEELHAGGHVVYVHCCEGVNRAPSLALAYLVRVEGLPIDEAVAQLRAVDPRARPYELFIEWLRAGES